MIRGTLCRHAGGGYSTCRYMDLGISSMSDNVWAFSMAGGFGWVGSIGRGAKWAVIEIPIFPILYPQ